MLSRRLEIAAVEVDWPIQGEQRNRRASYASSAFRISYPEHHRKGTSSHSRASLSISVFIAIFRNGLEIRFHLAFVESLFVQLLFFIPLE
jgi:hypothetical protein